MANTYEEVMSALRNADAAGDTEAATRLARIASSMRTPEAEVAPTQPVQEESPSSLTQLGRGMASLADTTVGAVLPTAAGMIAYPVARAFMSPDEASAKAQQIVGAIDKPFGKAFGVTETPEYRGEASQRLIAFIGENVNKGAQWISQQTGLPVSDVENMIGTLSLAAPAAVKPVAGKVAELAAPVMADVKAGTRLALDKPLSAREQRLSDRDYQRGPEIEAATDAQRLGIAIPPEAAQPGVSTRLLSAAAGDAGTARLAKVNQQNVRSVALNELGLPPTTQLNSVKPFQEARSKVAEPYNQVRALPTMTADATTLSALDALLPDSSLIGAGTTTKAIQAIVGDAKAKVSKGINGNDLLRNVENLRSKARKVYNNKNASLAELELADARMGVANTLESMVESNIFNPRLLDDFRNARKQMAKSYAYEGATDLNTGVIDAGKLARITAKDNALTGDIAAIGRIAGNFPEAFGIAPTDMWAKGLSRLRRSGLTGTVGGLTGYALGGGYGGAVGAAAGALSGELGQYLAARRIANPEYQRGLNISDYRIPAAAQAVTGQAPIPNSQAVVPYQAPVEVLGPGEGPYTPNFVMRSSAEPDVQVVRPDLTGALPAPSAQSTMGALRAEDVRRANVSRSIGREQEAAMAAAEASQRRPATGEVILDFDPITGRFRESSAGLRGATPETFSNFGSSLETAANKVSKGTKFDMTAAEKVAWERTKVDVSLVQPGFKALTDKAIANKMLDREWVAETAQKARDKAAAFANIAQRAKNEQAMQKALAEREKMMDLAEQMEETLRMSRPDVSRKQQGPKTRQAFRESIMSRDSGLFD